MGNRACPRHRFAKQGVAHSTGFEPVTSAFGGQRSIQLSYECLRFLASAGYKENGPALQSESVFLRNYGANQV